MKCKPNDTVGYVVEADSVLNAIRSALSAPLLDSHIVHYWWRDKVCLVAFAFGHKLYFLNVYEPESGAFSVEVERVVERS